MEQITKEKLIAAYHKVAELYTMEPADQDTIDEMTLRLEREIKRILNEDKQPSEEDFPIELDMVNTGNWKLESINSILEFYPDKSLTHLKKRVADNS